jgi:hypothetical protein
MSYFAQARKKRNEKKKLEWWSGQLKVGDCVIQIYMNMDKFL